MLALQAASAKLALGRVQDSVPWGLSFLISPAALDSAFHVGAALGTGAEDSQQPAGGAGPARTTHVPASVELVVFGSGALAGEAVAQQDVEPLLALASVPPEPTAQGIVRDIVGALSVAGCLRWHRRLY